MRHKYWTYIDVSEEAKKYTTRTEFCKKSSGAYEYARKNNILDIICCHMKICGNTHRRTIYTVKFNRLKVFYTGLTFSFDRRKWQHLRFSHNKELRELLFSGEPCVWECNNVFHCIEVAKIKENEEIKKLENEGWRKLNKAKAGGLGGNTVKWTKEKVLQEASKFKTRNEFSKNMRGAYAYAKKNNFLEEIFSKMKPFVQNKWNPEDVKLEAKKYNIQREFEKKSPSAYYYMRRHGLTEEFCSHMKKLEYWSKEKVAKEAKKFKSRKEFHIQSKSAYGYAWKNGILDEICSHMDVKNKRWKKEEIIECAKKYKSKKEFERNSCKEYQYAWRHKILDEVCFHMK